MAAKGKERQDVSTLLPAWRQLTLSLGFPKGSSQVCSDQRQPSPLLLTCYANIPPTRVPSLPPPPPALSHNGSPGNHRTTRQQPAPSLSHVIVVELLATRRLWELSSDQANRRNRPRLSSAWPSAGKIQTTQRGLYLHLETKHFKMVGISPCRENTQHTRKFLHPKKCRQIQLPGVPPSSVRRARERFSRVGFGDDFAESAHCPFALAPSKGPPTSGILEMHASLPISS